MKPSLVPRFNSLGTFLGFHLSVKTTHLSWLHPNYGGKNTVKQEAMGLLGKKLDIPSRFANNRET